MKKKMLGLMLHVDMKFLAEYKSPLHVFILQNIVVIKNLVA